MRAPHWVTHINMRGCLHGIEWSVNDFVTFFLCSQLCIYDRLMRALHRVPQLAYFYIYSKGCQLLFQVFFGPWEGVGTALNQPQSNL